MGLRGIAATPVKVFKESHHEILVTGKNLAEKVISFIQGIPVTSGLFAGKLFKLLPWEKRAIKQIYKTNKRGRRMVREVVISIPRKNGKTALAAGLGLAHLCGPASESRGQIYSAAADRKQAALIYDEMKAMILSTNLKTRVIIRDFNKHLEDTVTGSVYFALSADATTKHGFSASCIIYDELAQAPDRRLYDALTTSTGARKDPLTIVISTQSPDNHSVMSELVDYGLEIQRGEKKNPNFLPILYMAPDDSDIYDEKVWKACNPSLGHFRSIEEMRIKAARAKQIPSEEATFRLLYLNQRVNAEARFIAMSEWDACTGEFNVESLKGRKCYAGLDLASTTDIAALSLVFPGDPFIVLPFFWIPEENMHERSTRDHVPYELWAKKGLIQATPGNLIDYRWIMLKIGQCRIDYDLKMLAFDRWGSQKIVTDLCDEIGFTVEEKEAARTNKPLLLQFPQGIRTMSPPTKELLNMILSRKIAHGGNPVLRWMANNVVVKTDAAGNIQPDKGKSIEKIDGIVASIMSLDIALRYGGTQPPHPYEGRGVLRI